MFKSFVNSFLKEEDGQDLVEYALLLAFLSLGCIVILGNVKTQLNTLFGNVSTQMASAGSAATAGK